MPALPVHPGVLKIRTLFSVGADASVGTTVYFTYTGTAPTDATCVTLAGDIYAAAVTHLVPVLGDENYLTGVDVTDLSSPTSGFGTHAASTVGTRGGAPLPANAAVLLNMPIARRYRGGKPRGYWPLGVYSDLDSPQLWSSGALSDFNAALSGYFNEVVALSVSGCALQALVSISNYEGFVSSQNPITHRWKNIPTPRAVAIAPDVVLTFYVNTKVGSQRRRLLHSV